MGSLVCGLSNIGARAFESDSVRKKGIEWFEVGIEGEKRVGMLCDRCVPVLYVARKTPGGGLLQD